MYAQMRELKREEFKNNNLDRLLRFRFASETEIISGYVPEQVPIYSVDAANMDPKILYTILHGCIARWQRYESPIYIALADGANFDEEVLKTLKAIYYVMPYGMRARCGFITCPNEWKPDGVSLCFIRESMISRYAVEPVLVLRADQTYNEQAMQKILSRKISGRNIENFLEYLTLSNEQHEFFEMINWYEGNSSQWEQIDCRVYNELYWLRCWNQFNDDEKRKFILEYTSNLQSLDAPLLIQYAWSNVFNEYINLHFAQWLQQASRAALFADFAKQIGPYKVIVDHLKNYEPNWREAFCKYTECSLKRIETVGDEFSQARKALVQLFGDVLVGEMQKKVKNARQIQQEKEHKEFSNRIKSEIKCAGCLWDFYRQQKGFLECNIKFLENQPMIKKVLETEITEMLKTYCHADKWENNFASFAAISNSYEKLVKVIPDLSIIWEPYHKAYEQYRSEELSRYFGAVSRGERVQCPECCLLDYITHLKECLKQNGVERQMRIEQINWWLERASNDVAENVMEEVALDKILAHESVEREKSHKNKLWALNALCHEIVFVCGEGVQIKYDNKTMNIASVLKAIQCCIEKKRTNKRQKDFMKALKQALKHPNTQVKTSRTKPTNASGNDQPPSKMKFILLCSSGVILAAVAVLVLFFVFNNQPEEPAYPVVGQTSEQSIPEVTAPTEIDTTIEQTQHQDDTTTYLYNESPIAETTLATTTITTTTTTATTATQARINYPTMTLSVGQQFQLAVVNGNQQGVFFEDVSGDRTIISVDRTTGEVTAHRPGTARINVHRANGSVIGSSRITVTS